MAVSKIKIASIIGVDSALDDVVRLCGKSQFFHPENALNFFSKTKNFSPFKDKDEMLAPLKKMQNIVSAIDKKLEYVNIDDFEASINEVKDYVDYLYIKIEKLLKKKQEAVTAIEAYGKSLAQIKPFAGLDINLSEVSNCTYIKARFGKLPKESYDKLMKKSEVESNPYVLFFPCTHDEKFYWGVYFAPLEFKAEIDRIFARLYFERIRIDEKDGTVEEKIALIESKINDEKENLEKINAKIQSFWEIQKDQCMRFYTKLEELNTYANIKKFASKYHNNFILVGWIPEENEAEFSQLLDGLDGIEYSIDRVESEEKHKPPVKLKNNWFSRPFETFVKMYGLPNYNEIDPTCFVAITYTLMYGIMFGDIGHGLILALVGAFMWKLKKFALGPIMVRCGLSGAFFGAIYGSVFGYEHVLDPFYKSAFGLDEKPIEVMASNTIMKVIAAAILLGIILIIAAILMKIFLSIKLHDIENLLFSQNGICGLIFYISLVVALVGQMFLNIKILSPGYIIFLLVVPIFLIFLKKPLSDLLLGKKNWQPASWGEYISQSFFEIYVVLLEFILNTISFLRVGAYVLSHAGFMMGVFIIAGMVPAPGNIAVVIFGNAFVIGLEGLLVGIQVLRLEFYEMFSRFFEGNGKAFAPVQLPCKSLGNTG
ncbi:MAG: ATPase [Clostridia bacterium]|nr:ATPase [Clostridia bacterium]